MLKKAKEDLKKEKKEQERYIFLNITLIIERIKSRDHAADALAKAGFL
jgi:hypothetical protein